MDKEKILEIAKPHDTWNSGFTDKEYYGFTTEDLIAFAHAIIETERESSGVDKKLLAYKTLVESLEARIASHENNRLSYQEARDTLESERECNKRLTEELAERESSDEPVGYVWESHFVDTGKSIKLFLETPEFPPGVVSDLPIVPVYKHPPRARKLTDDAMKLFRDIECRINGEEE